MEVSGKRSDNETVSTTERELCQPCHDEHATTRADGICQECKEYMCNTCFRHHLKARQCRNHVLIDASLSPVLFNTGDEDLEKCRHHENEKIKYYCRIHDIVGCGDCMVAEHSACKPEFIKNLSNDLQKNDDSKLLVRRIEKLVSTIKDSEEGIQDEKRESKTMHEVALKEIRKFRADIDEYLDKAEADVLAELNRFQSENEDLLTKLEKDCKLHTSKTEEIKRRISTKTDKREILFINSVQCKSDVLDIERTVAELQSENNIKKITFLPDKQLHDIVTSGIKLGNIEDQESVNVKSKFLQKGKSAPGMQSSDKQVTAKSHDIRSKTEDTRRRGQKNEDDVVFETFYHRSGKEFQCIYQSGMRFYHENKEWLPFPKRWYNEGLLVTNSVIKDENKQ